MIKVAIITITYNSSNVIIPFLKCLSESSFKDFKLFIIDNNSVDDTIELIYKIKKIDFQIIENKKNIGVAAANNIGIKLALEQSYQKILLSNNDIVFDKNIIADLVNFSENQSSSISSLKIMYEHDKDKIWYCGGFFNFNKGLVPEHLGIGKPDFGQYNHLKYSDYAPTCFVLFDSKVFSEIGLMDEEYFVYFDDTDFFYRVKKNGNLKLLINQKIKIFHKVGSLTSTSNARGIKSNFFISQNIQNHFYFLKKNERLYFYLFIPFLFIRYNLRTILSNQYKFNFNTLLLVNKSIFKGILK
ncbi:glycosyltransferase family 2 protein [Bacteroidota bacterium]|nr:glycosyltransferase family 2 protein [Bacteroidota bacterium]